MTPHNAHVLKWIRWHRWCAEQGRRWLAVAVWAKQHEIESQQGQPT